MLDKLTLIAAICLQRDEKTSLMATWWIRAAVCPLFAVKKRKAVIGVVLKGAANKNGLI